MFTCTLTCILFTNDRTPRDNVSVHGISILSLDVRYYWLSESGYMSTKDPERKSSSESNVDKNDITSRNVTPGFKPFSILNFHWHSDSVVGMVMQRANNGITSLEFFYLLSISFFVYYLFSCICIFFGLIFIITRCRRVKAFSWWKEYRHGSLVNYCLWRSILWHYTRSSIYLSTRLILHFWLLFNRLDGLWIKPLSCILSRALRHRTALPRRSPAVVR